MASAPSKRANWRLKKTLARRVEFRPIENADIRYAWAAYKKGSLRNLAGPFSQTNLTADQFKPTFEQLVLARYHGAWTLFAETPKGFLPVGMVFAFFSHPDPALSPFMILGDIVRFPWACPRNSIESEVGFFSKIRKEIPIMGYAHGDTDRKYFECLCKHAIMQRVGTTFNVIRGKAVAIFETMAR